MAHLSAQVSTVQRSKGQNAIASAAYNSRSKLPLTTIEKETNISAQFIWDYSHKGGLAYSKIHAPDHAPAWVYDRELLWNKAEQAENRCDARTAHKIMLPLPNELTIEQNIAIVEECVAELVAMGMIVDANIHDDNPNNIHAHLMCTMRELVKNRYGEIEFSSIKNRDWHKKTFVDFVRQMHTQKVNKHYEMYGFDKRFYHESYKSQDIDLIPGKHEGPARNLKNAELIKVNNQIAADNAEKIKARPDIILDILAMNQPVFTKEQIASELEKLLYARIDFSKVKDVELLTNELSATFIKLYEHILNCPEISQVIEADLKGRTLYTTTKRLQLEERFTDTITTLSKSNHHALGLDKSALDHLSLPQLIVEKTKDTVNSITGHVNDKTGLKLEQFKKPESLSLEQRKAIINILNGADICVLEGIPGAGKTTAMRELVRQYRKAGYKVIGASPSSSAALELAKATGIECKNATLWRKEWLEGRGKEFELVLRGTYYREEKYHSTSGNVGTGLTKNHVMIIDEASMIELANIDYLVSEAKAAGAKILLVGDSNQLSPVGWAGALGKAISICGSERLAEPRRQQNPLHQEATKLLGQYKIRKTLDIFWQGGNIKVSKTQAEANRVCQREFVSSYIEEAKKLKSDDLVSIRSRAIGVFENKTRRILNEAVRSQLKEAGILKGDERAIWVGGVVGGRKQKICLMRGEQIVFSRNINNLGADGIFNGEFGTVLKVGKADQNDLAIIDILVHKASGKKEKVSLDLKDLAKKEWFNDGAFLEHGYAITAHKVQGASIDDFSVVLEKGIGFEVFNVLATRHRHNVSFYSNKELLSDVFYEALDQTAVQSRNRFQLEEATGCSKVESLEIVASHAGITPVSKNNYAISNQVILNDAKNDNINKYTTKDEWVINTKDIANAPKFNPKKDLIALAKSGMRVIETYEYKNQDNQLLGYSVRVEEQASGKKQVLPVAFCYNAKTEKSRWMAKGFTDKGTKPIYGAQKLVQSLEKPVLIVEGEKTANSAAKLLPDYIVLSWMGGAQGVDKVDWAKLASRIVVIWPDNDKPGIEAANTISEYIDNHNGFTGLVWVVDTKKLNLPEKWDLADDLPAHINNEQLLTIVNTASNSYNSIAVQLSINKQNQEQHPGKQTILDALNMLVEKGKTDKDQYVANEIYHDTLLSIAKNNQIELTKPESFVDEIRTLQEKYQSLQIAYEKNLYAENNQNNKDIHGIKEQLVYELVRDTCLLHQVQLGVKQLTKTHQGYIEETVQAEVSKMRVFGDKEKEHAGSTIYKTITSSNWLEKLGNLNQEKAKEAKLRLKAKYLQSNEDFTKQRQNKAVEDTKKNEQENSIDQLQKLTKFMQAKGFNKNETMTKILKNSPSSVEAHKVLLKTYQDHFIKTINKGINLLKKGETVKFDNKSWSCPMKFLKHITKTRTSEYTPHQELQKIQTKLIQHQNRLEMTKEMNGPGF